MPSSIERTAQTWKAPRRAASTTSSASIRCRTFVAGTITPCSPVRPRALQAAKTFDLVRDAADRLHVAVLVDRARDRDILSQRQPGQRRQERVELRRGG